MKIKSILWVAIAATLAIVSCTKEEGQTNSSGQSGTTSESIVGKTLYTDLFCAMPDEDGYANRQYEFRFSSDNVLFIREGQKLQKTGEMRWGDPMRWTYSIDNSVVTIEGDYSSDHLIKMGTILSGDKVKWEGQSAYDENKEEYMSFKKVFKYGLTISTNPRTITSPWFGWAFEGRTAIFYQGGWSEQNCIMAFGRSHVIWRGPTNASSGVVHKYWDVNIDYPNIVIKGRSDYDYYDTIIIAQGQFTNNDQTLQIQFRDGSPTLDTARVIEYTRTQL